METRKLTQPRHLYKRSEAIVFFAVFEVTGNANGQVCGPCEKARQDVRACRLRFRKTTIFNREGANV